MQDNIPVNQTELHYYLLVLVATLKKLQNKTDKKITDVDEFIKTTKEELLKLINEIEAMPGPKGERGEKGETIKGDAGRDGRDGRDGYTPVKGKDYFDGKDAVVDEASIVQKSTTMTTEAVKHLIPTIEQIEQDIPKLGQPIRDALELLPRGEGGPDERLVIEAIKGLREELDELKKQNGTQVFGGASGIKEGSIVENEVVSGSGTTWTILYALVPGSEKIFANGQRLTPGAGNDYTILGQTVTTAQSWDAGNLLCDYRR